MHSTSIWLSSLAIAAAGGWFAATMFAGPATSKEPRFPQLTMDQLDEKQKPLGEQIMKVSSVGLGGPYNLMLRSPVLGQRMFDMFHYLRWETSVPLKLNEFAILIIARQWRSQVEWFAHAPLAAKAGLDPETIAALGAGRKPDKMKDDEAIVWEFNTQLRRDHGVDDAIYAKAVDKFGENGVMDLVAVNGYYDVVSMTLNVARVKPPAEAELPFKQAGQ